jgi:hypothetical protein
VMNYEFSVRLKIVIIISSSVLIFLIHNSDQNDE